ncbi:MAG: hypothetical protein R3E52_17200 [Burkholderiaceae bacterium]
MTAVPALNFGIHAGKPLSEVPADYLLWASSAFSMRRLRPELLPVLVDELARRLAEDRPGVLAALQTLPPRSPSAKARRRREAKEQAAKERAAERGRRLERIRQRHAEARPWQPSAAESARQKGRAEAARRTAERLANARPTIWAPPSDE